MIHKRARAETNAVFKKYLEGFPGSDSGLVEAILAFRQAAMQFYVGQESVFAKHSLTVGRFNLLLLLKSRGDHKLSPSELAHLSLVSRGTVTQFVDTLERDGLVRRRDDPRDRRSMLIELTAKGETILRKVMPDYLEYASVTIKGLTATERKTLLKLYQKINLAHAAAEE